MRNKQPFWQIFGSILVLLILAGCGGAQTTPTATATPVPPTSTPVPPTATPYAGIRSVDVGGYELLVKCIGEESPTVVLDAGSPGGMSAWRNVTRKIESHTRARICAYSRAGLEGSDPAPEGPRTSEDMMRDLHTLLTNADIPGPYVLVGHSLSGFTARLYADEYPQDVVGMVLVDSTHPDQCSRWLAHLPLESPYESTWGKWLRKECVADTDPLDQPENLDLKTSIAQVRTTGPLGSIPLIVLTQDVYDLTGWKIFAGADSPPDLAESLAHDWLRMQEELAELSSNSTHIIVEGSGHNIPGQKPGAVIDAILQVVDAVRGE